MIIKYNEYKNILNEDVIQPININNIFNSINRSIDRVVSPTQSKGREIRQSVKTEPKKSVSSKPVVKEEQPKLDFSKGEKIEQKGDETKTIQTPVQGEHPDVSEDKTKTINKNQL